MHETYFMFVAAVGNNLFVENLKGGILCGYLQRERTE